MKPGEIVLISLPQVGGGPSKLRPALLLSRLPGPYQNLLLCGVSTQLHQLVPNWDELLDANELDYAASGVHQPSVIRLSYVYAANAREITGVIGEVETSRLQRLLSRLSDYLRP